MNRVTFAIVSTVTHGVAFLAGLRLGNDAGESAGIRKGIRQQEIAELVKKQERVRE